MTQFCAEPGCGALVPNGRCPTHRRGFAESAPVYAGHHWYDTARWRRLRWDVFRSEPFCRVCRMAGERRLATEIDHIVKHDGDKARFFDRANLQPLCRPCHTRKTSRGE